MSVPPPGPDWTGYEPASHAYEAPPYESMPPEYRTGGLIGEPGYPPAGTNPMAIASVVSAVLFAPLGILLGHLSLGQIRRSGQRGRGLAVAGLVVGYLITAASVAALVFGLTVVRNAPAEPDPAASAGSPVAVPASPPPEGAVECSYPASTERVAKTVTPPAGGRVPTRPAVMEATMTTSAGTVGLQLDNAKAPCTVHSFVSLARQGYFDDTPCHRLTAAKQLGVLQCGDPTATGSGGPGYRFDDEYPTNQYPPGDPALRDPTAYPRGTLAMANAGPDTNGSQFFIVYRDSMLPPAYTVFGRVDEAGMAVLDGVARAGVKGGGPDGAPATPVTISSLTVK